MAHEHSGPGHSHSGDVLIRFAGTYDTAMRLWGRAGRRWREGLAASLRLHPGDRVLDVASGTGQLVLELARHVGPGGAVCGVDAAREMVDRATRTARRRRLAVTFQTALAQRLPFDDDSFDAVTCTLALHHIAQGERPQAVAEFARVLKPGGRLLIADFQVPAGRAARYITGALFAHALAERPLDQADILARAAGFTEVRREGSSIGWIGHVLATAAPGAGRDGSNAPG